MAVKRSRSEIVDAIQQIILGAVFPVESWRWVLDQHLNDRASGSQLLGFPILFGCVKDTAKGLASTNGTIRRLVADAKLTNRGNLFHSTCEVASIGVLSAELICRASTDEQVFLEIVRNRLVHGYLDGASRSHRNFTIVENPGFKVISVSKSEREELVAKFCPNGRLHEGIQVIFDRHKEAFKLYCDMILEHFKFDLSEVQNALSEGQLLFSETGAAFNTLRRELDTCYQ
ncbi:hypothetical protein GCM10016455_07470 [Aliiroseovarius zhejiangensis]|uniref:Uncharacterized protein n=1 Tax=Aliiroseovarius zhejiangensis TaxID=1632025 RepID=A0ABQ3IPC2_9RHOB|nr:hypothetical protein [Aliiroseovarius zhejiangensis]GHE89675.1 hypothetical protein GCM10016455_07470 [Aliiroseovarius zhejiangensis]